MRWLFFVLVSAFAATSAGAEIYKWILPNGEIRYSDRPPDEGAEKVELRPLVTFSPPPPPPASPEKTQAKSPAGPDGYDSFTIASPADDATVRSPGAGNLSVSFSIVPGLSQGHAIEIFLDGRRFGRSDNPAVTLNNLDRGTHRIHAAIVDNAGVEVARSETITVHLHR